LRVNAGAHNPSICVTGVRTPRAAALVVFVLLTIAVASCLPPMASGVGATANLAPLTLNRFYTLRGFLEDSPRHYMSLSGSLNFDWLGDISGEGSIHLSNEVPCHVLIEGTYKTTKDPLVKAGNITFVPVYGDCSEELGRKRNWTISIVREAPGELDLSQNPVSERGFTAVASRETTKLS
jgi:hypothetical protein